MVTSLNLPSFHGWFNREKLSFGHYGVIVYSESGCTTKLKYKSIFYWRRKQPGTHTHARRFDLTETEERTSLLYGRKEEKRRQEGWVGEIRTIANVRRRTEDKTTPDKRNSVDNIELKTNSCQGNWILMYLFDLCRTNASFTWSPECVSDAGGLQMTHTTHVSRDQAAD